MLLTLELPADKDTSLAASEVSHAAETKSEAVNAMETDDDRSTLAATVSWAAHLAESRDAADATSALLNAAVKMTNANRVVVIRDSGSSEIRAGHLDGRVLHRNGSPSSRELPLPLLHQTVENRVVSVSSQNQIHELGDYVPANGVEHLFCFPLIARAEITGLLYVELGAVPEPKVQLYKGLMAFLTYQAANLLDAIDIMEHNTELEAKNNALRDEVVSCQAASILVARLGRTGCWAWDTESGSMTIETELSSLLGILAGDSRTIWDFNASDEATIPAGVSNAISKRTSFETEIQILRPNDDAVTILRIAGEPSIPGSPNYVGVASEISSQNVHHLRTASSDRTSMLALLHQVADPLTAISLNTAAGIRWLLWNRKHEAQAALEQVDTQVSRISAVLSDALLDGPLATPRATLRQWQ